MTTRQSSQAWPSVFLLVPVLLILTTTGVSSAATPPSPNTQTTLTRPPFNALIVGDSLTNGKDGQHTWRYRFWQWLSIPTVSHVHPHFVGPFTGTFLPDPNKNSTTYFQTNGSYAPDVDPTFLSGSNSGSSHAAYWGRPLSWSAQTIGPWVSEYQPDWVLLMMGYNDLAWMGESPETLMGWLQVFIDNARGAKTPEGLGLNFLVANVPYRDFGTGNKQNGLQARTERYNKWMEGNLTRLEGDGGGGVVRLVDVASTYGCRPGWCPDGWDGLHPNEDGEWDIARAFSKAMVQVGLVGRAIGGCLID